MTSINQESSDREVPARDVPARDVAARDVAARDVEETIAERIVEYLRDEFLGQDVQIARDDDLLSGEILDSVAILSLSAFVAEEYDIVVQPTDFVIENFQNVAVLASYVFGALDR